MRVGMDRITSAQNPHIKEVMHLRAKRKREEPFIIDGLQEILFALDSGFVIEKLFYCPELFANKGEEKIVKRVKSALLCEERVFKKIAYRENPEGLLALATPIYRSLESLKVTQKGIFLLADIEKPGNLGAILRSADAVRADAVVVIEGSLDIYNPNVIRSSMGCLFSQPVVIASIEEITRWLKKERITLFAATPEAPLCYSDASLTFPLAFIVGQEHEGLSTFWKERADFLLSIPMQGKINSLNVAMSATLLLFEAARKCQCR